jgi:hypothetical protein
MRLRKRSVKREREREREREGESKRNNQKAFCCSVILSKSKNFGLFCLSNPSAYYLYCVSISAFSFMNKHGFALLYDSVTAKPML